MLEIGLIPTSTGAPGGEKTGQRMYQLVDPDGPFKSVCDALIKDDFKIEFLDRFAPARWQRGYFHDPDGSDTRDRQDGTQAETDPDKVALERTEEEGESGEPLGPETPPAADPAIANLLYASGKKNAKHCYACPVCGCKAWGRPSLVILCNTTQSCNSAQMRDVSAPQSGSDGPAEGEVVHESQSTT